MAILFRNSSIFETVAERENEEEVKRNESRTGHCNNTESRIRGTRTMLYAYCERVIDHQWLEYLYAHENESSAKQIPSERIILFCIGNWTRARSSSAIELSSSFSRVEGKNERKSDSLITRVFDQL